VSGSPIKRPTEVKNTLPIGRIEGSKKPIETHTPLIRYFINDIDPKATFGSQLESKTCCNRAVGVRDGNPLRDLRPLARQIVSVREK
jgi:hypothetical protein